MGNSSSFEVLGKGKVLLKLTSSKTLALNNVMYVPALRRNLISGCLLNKACIKLVFEIDKLVLSRNDDYIGKGFLNGGLFVIETQLNENKVSTSTYIVETVDMWHARLGHMNIHSLKKMMKMNILPKLDITNFNKCEICVEAKHAKPHFKSVSNRKTELLELIHTDLADFRNTESKGGKHYYITFVDDFSRYTKVYLLRTKDEAEKFFLIYKAEVENQFDRRIKRLRSDRGGEYGSNFLKRLDSETQIEKLPSTSSSVPARSSQEIEFEPRRIDLPRGFRTISNKWVFRKKLRPDGSIQKYKAMLVVKGFTQKFGIDFFDTYSPVTKISTIRALFALASIHKLHVHQMDVKTAFLNGELDEEIYMEQPLRFEAPGMEGKVCRLKKSLYGLKQAPK
ncbi:hypothetical protein V6N11_000703 [Hibiscus sabdariffa]|uniref:Integrase catalytic domain-containing protein n=1 Tax=Hibiscus sabdariffa TaxID=183260 RepID=A0ABR2RXI6_9ROSI